MLQNIYIYIYTQTGKYFFLIRRLRLPLYKMTEDFQDWWRKEMKFIKRCAGVTKGTIVTLLFWTVLLVVTVLSCVGNTAISSGIDRLPRGQIVAVLLRWYRVYRQQTDRQPVIRHCSGSYRPRRLMARRDVWAGRGSIRSGRACGPELCAPRSWDLTWNRRERPQI